MASLTPLAVAELANLIAATRSELAAADLPRSAMTKALRALHDGMMRATHGVDTAPQDCLTAAAELLARVPAEVVDALSPRPRTALRLLRAGASLAAWEVLADNATGVVEEPYDAATATGAARTSPRLPLLTTVEAGLVFAELPGFRDPRFAAPEECYDITSLVRLKHQLDELLVTGSDLVLSGWAALDVLTASVHERVAIVLTAAETTVAIPGHRVRRADLVSGRGDGLTRRAWAGWSAALDLGDPRLSSGRWSAWLELDHGGVSRREPIGREVALLAAAAARASIRVGTRSLRWDTSGKQWVLVVE